MADYTARSTVILNGKQAEDQLEKLNSRAAELREEMKKLRQANDMAGFDKKERELKQVNKEMAQMKKEAFSVENVLKNLSSASFKEISTAARKANNEFKAMKQTDPGYAAKAAQAKLLNDKLRQMGQLTRSQQSLWGRMGDGFNKYFGMATAAVASLTGVVFGFRKASQASNDFEERIDNLSALTGLAGEELQWLEQRSKDLSTATLAGGVKVKQGAQEIVDAFTKTGSARPELLKNKEALSEVTEEAIILSNASKDDLQPSIEALTMVLNQYNVSASESRRIINALAAGSKEGAGEIPYLTTGFEKAGTVAADADISIETLVATLETLAPRITQAEVAGRSLKGVILDMQNSTDDINPSIVGWTTALENLNKKNLTTTQLTKMFGTENITTAKILLNNIGELKKYEAAVTGTNVAIEQATTNTDNANAKLAQARNRLQEVTIEFGEKLSPAVLLSTNGFTYFVKVGSAVLDVLEKHGRTIITATVAVAGYTIATKTAAFWTTAYATTKGILTGQITLATIAQRAWNLALKANPIGLIIGIIAGGIAWLISWNKETGKVTEAFRKLGPVIDSIKKWFTDLYNESFLVRAGFHYFFAMLTTGFTAVTAILRTFWEQLKLGGKLLKAVLTFDLKGIKEAFTDYASGMKDVALDSARKVGETWATGFNSAVKGKIKPVDVPVYGPLQSKQNTGFTSSGIGDLVTGSNPYVRPGIPSPNKPNTTPEKPGQSNDTTPEEPVQSNDITPFIDASFEDKKAALRKYFDDIKKIKEEAALTDPDIADKYKTEETEGKDPALDYALKQYMETNDYKLALNQSMYDKGLIGEQEYQDNLTRIHNEEEEARLKKTQEAEDAKQQKREDVARAAQDIAKMSGDFVMALMDLELEKAGEDEEKKKEIKKKYADLNFAVTAAQIVASTAGAIMQGYEQLGPIAGTVAAVLLGATGLIQLGVANTERQKVQGYAKGKYPGLQTGMYGDKPHYALFNEVPGKPEMVIDGVTTSEIRLNYPEIEQAIYAIRDGRIPKGYASGKYPASTIVASPAESEVVRLKPASGSDSELRSIIEANTAAMRELKNLKIYTAIEDIKIGEKKYTEIQNTRGL
jgi:TP901 family phage tail tape measure protein